MCEELNEELNRGNEAAKALAEHCKAMGADKGTHRYVDEDGDVYTVTVEKETIKTP